MNGIRSPRQALFTGLLLLTSVTPPAYSGPGDLDVRFGTHGQAEIPGQVDSAALVALSDGRILVFGVSPQVATRDAGAIAIARLHADGSVDATFGPGGHRDVTLGNEPRPVPTDALPLPDGQVLVAGYFAGASGPSDPGWLVRLSKDGEIDPNFGVGGVARAGATGISRVALLADGAIAVAAPGLLGRLDPNGAPVMFPGSEHSVVAIGTYPVSALVPTQDGGLIMSGADTDWGGFELYRLGPSGTPRVGWRSNAPHDFTEIGSFARAPNDPRVTACGSLYGKTLVVQRWQDDGTTDPTFAAATAGHVELGLELRPDFRTDIWSDVHCRGILAAPAGGHLVVGDWNKPYEWGGGHVLLARLDVSGTVDTSFDPSRNGRLLSLGSPDHWSEWYVVDAETAADGAALLLARSPEPPPADAPFEPGPTRTLIVARVEVSVPRSAGSIGFNDAAVRVAERRPGELRVYRSGGSTGTVSVRYELLPGTASATDVMLPGGTLTWPDGDAAFRTIALTTIDDDEMEGEESFRVRLSTPTGGAGLGAPEIEVTIEDDEALSALQFTQPALTAKEGSSVEVAITRPAATAGPVVVHYAWAADLDPQGTPRPRDGARIQRSPVGELRWAADDTSSRTVRVYTYGLGGVQPDGTGYVVLADVAGTLSADGAWKRARVTIVDDPELNQAPPPPPPEQPPGGTAGGGASGETGGGGSCSLELLGLLALALLRLRTPAAGLRPYDAAPRAARVDCGGADAPVPPVPGSARCS